MGNQSKKINRATGLKAGPKRVAKNQTYKAKARVQKARRWAKIMGSDQ